jgi:hypothetical protein
VAVQLEVGEDFLRLEGALRQATKCSGEPDRIDSSKASSEQAVEDLLNMAAARHSISMAIHFVKAQAIGLEEAVAEQGASVRAGTRARPRGHRRTAMIRLICNRAKVLWLYLAFKAALS